MLLADAPDNWPYAIYVVILALVGLFSLVRKFFEKAAAGKKGEKIDLGKSVHGQLKKYMDAMDPSRKERTPPPIETAPRPIETAPLRPPAVPASTRLPPPRPRPEASVPLEDRIPAGVLDRPLLAHLRKPKWELDMVAKEQRARALLPTHIKSALTGKQLRTAVILAEILGPPVSERKDYRLF